MASDSRLALSSYLTGLLAAGKVVFLRDEAQKALGVSGGAFLDAAERQQRKRHLLMPRRGFYVVVPPQYLSWGAPPTSWFIDDLMRHEGRPYYVGLLKAAELHGAAHQAVMAFQIVTDKRLPDLRAGRAAITFCYRRDMDAVAAGIEDRKTDTGRMKVSGVELTALDLLRYPHVAGGLDNIATVLAELAEGIDGPKLAVLSAAFERSVVQRLGYLLDYLGYAERAERLHMALAGGSAAWTELEPGRAAAETAPLSRNERWRVLVRRLPERDE